MRALQLIGVVGLIVLNVNVARIADEMEQRNLLDAMERADADQAEYDAWEAEDAEEAYWDRLDATDVQRGGD